MSFNISELADNYSHQSKGNVFYNISVKSFSIGNELLFQTIRITIFYVILHSLIMQFLEPTF